jgi:hypothetical protein
MLDSYIIDEIKRREEERRRREDQQRPRLEIPIIPIPDADTNPAKRDEDSPPRGVVIIDYSV